ncbi:SDR family oxidoreductase [Paraburkholderia sp. CNPSo 3272]|uniref:SDR family oxidoreductase n=1 Tax=Paraburkholderia sp. CNPSo 3272 TaxID=2940931 RepID=UPI0020B73D5B|nr:SDR family oxidoreductase [Paraburkholderia sp. CNPSo 3272]MCP3722952.1 SDR family oxidoreductase [Paraburkholderia sp. CNPSo 3272]
MRIKLKPLSEQVVVITGAISGIGLATARHAVKAGARVMLVARNGEALDRLDAELTQAGGEVAHHVADVADKGQLQSAADAAIARFGTFDTWVNNAGVSTYGRLEDTPLEDQRRLFETNYWGVVHGSLVALPQLKKNGGALINLGSELSDAFIPLQGAYIASKHAVMGFTDTLRLELLADHAPVSVTLIKPSGIDTMFVEHAKNLLDFQPRLPPPVYAPDVVARAILHAASHPVRDLYVGSAGRATVGLARLLPSVFDRIVSRLGVNAQRTDREKVKSDGLHETASELRERSGHNGHVRETSFYTNTARHRSLQTALLTGGAALLAASLIARRKSRLARL